MNILKLIGGNWLRGPETRRFPDRQPPAADYRGDVVNDAAVCVACGICAHVCVSAAIELNPSDDFCAWVYDPARCTYCGFCVQHCPVDALRQMPDRGSPAHRPGEYAQTTIIKYPTCPQCGTPTMPCGETLAEKAYGQRVEALRELAQLCEQCRRQATAQSVRKTAVTRYTDRSSHGR